MAGPDCGRDKPTFNDADIAVQTDSYPPSSSNFGELHDIQFPYHNACQAIAVCRDIAGMLRNDLDERGDVEDRGGPSGSMVATMTKDGAGGWRTGNAETVGFDAAWAAQKRNLGALVEALEVLVGDLEEAWDSVVAENAVRVQNRSDYDAWEELMLAQQDPQATR